jgi:hypothetical protein
MPWIGDGELLGEAVEEFVEGALAELLAILQCGVRRAARESRCGGGHFPAHRGLDAGEQRGQAGHLPPQPSES